MVSVDVIAIMSSPMCTLYSLQSPLVVTVSVEDTKKRKIKKYMRKRIHELAFKPKRFAVYFKRILVSSTGSQLSLCFFSAFCFRVSCTQPTRWMIPLRIISLVHGCQSTGMKRCVYAVCLVSVNESNLHLAHGNGFTNRFFSFHIVFALFFSPSSSLLMWVPRNFFFVRFFRISFLFLIYHEFEM